MGLPGKVLENVDPVNVRSWAYSTYIRATILKSLESAGQTWLSFLCFISIYTFDQLSCPYQFAYIRIIYIYRKFHSVSQYLLAQFLSSIENLSSPTPLQDPFTLSPLPVILYKNAVIESMLANTPVLARGLAFATPGHVLHVRGVLVRSGRSIRWTRTTLGSFRLFFFLMNGVFKVVDGAIVVEDAAKGSFGEWVLFSVGMPGHFDL